MSEERDQEETLQILQLIAEIGLKALNEPLDDANAIFALGRKEGHNVGAMGVMVIPFEAGVKPDGNGFFVNALMGAHTSSPKELLAMVLDNVRETLHQKATVEDKDGACAECSTHGADQRPH